MSFFWDLLGTIFATARDVAPIVLVIGFFQFVVLRKQIPHLRQTVIGVAYVLIGMAFFLIGLEKALFPLGRLMAEQLTDPHFIMGDAWTEGGAIEWWRYYWVYIFAAAIGFSTTIAEPSLMAVALKAEEASGGALKPWALRIAVAVGVAASISIGAYRIVTGASLATFMMVGYMVVIIQTIFAPKLIVPLAYDSGGVTTSTVTVPLVAALGLGLATTVPGRSALLDGFGLIALASLFPIITVMAYAQISEFLARRGQAAVPKTSEEIRLASDQAQTLQAKTVEHAAIPADRDPTKISSTNGESP
jgi:hypothetical protein